MLFRDTEPIKMPIEKALFRFEYMLKADSRRGVKHRLTRASDIILVWSRYTCLIDRQYCRSYLAYSKIDVPTTKNERSQVHIFSKTNSVAVSYFVQYAVHT